MSDKTDNKNQNKPTPKPTPPPVADNTPTTPALKPITFTVRNDIHEQFRDIQKKTSLNRHQIADMALSYWLTNATPAMYTEGLKRMQANLVIELSNMNKEQ